MKIIVELNKKSGCPVSKKLLQEVIRKTVRLCGYDFLQSKEVIVDVAVVSSGEIRKINKKHRKINKETDILSFANYNNEKAIKNDNKSSIFLGELIICCEYVKKSAKIDAVPIKHELVYVLAHGLLHLLGFKHDEKMFNIQDKVTKALI